MFCEEEELLYCLLESMRLVQAYRETGDRHFGERP